MNYIFSERPLRVLQTVFLLLILVPQYGESYEYTLKAIFLSLGILCEVVIIATSDKKKGLLIKRGLIILTVLLLSLFFWLIRK